VLQAGGDEASETPSAAWNEVQRESDRLTRIIACLEQEGEVKEADEKRKLKAKLRWPPPARPAQDRASLTARLAELEEKHDGGSEKMRREQANLMTEQESIVLALPKDIAEAEAAHAKTLEVIREQHLIAVQVIEKKLKAKAADIQRQAEEYVAKVAEVNICLRKLECAVAPPIMTVEQQASRMKEAGAIITPADVSLQELQRCMVEDPALGDIGAERAAVMARWFCQLLNTKASLRLSGLDASAGSGMGSASGQAAAGQQPEGGLELKEDEEMTELSESETEAEKRKVNADEKGERQEEAKKIKVKRCVAAGLRETKAKKLKEKNAGK
jgi:hypothetical protein